jgi:nitrate reductase gamma subunit
MASVRNWAAGSAIAMLILLSPVGAFLAVIAAEVLIDMLMEAGVTGVCAVTIGVVGCVLFRRILRSETARQSGAKEVCEAPPIAVPPG